MTFLEAFTAALLTCSADTLVVQSAHYPWEAVEYGVPREIQHELLATNPVVLVNGEFVGQLDMVVFGFRERLGCGYTGPDLLTDAWVLRVTPYVYDHIVTVGYLEIETAIFFDSWESEE